jgi:hypothetical protein
MHCFCTFCVPRILPPNSYYFCKCLDTFTLSEIKLNSFDLIKFKQLLFDGGLIALWWGGPVFLTTRLRA